MAELILVAESTFTSPWVFHALVALEEKGLAYRLEVVPFPLAAERRAEMEERAVIGKVPALAHGELWISESLAISEYLAETFPTPGHPRIFPANLAERARARQVMNFLRTDLFALREERPTTTIFGAPAAAAAPLSASGRAAADLLVRVAGRVVAGPWMFAEWNIADADLALALMRLVKNGDPVPARLEDYARAVWERPSVRRFLTTMSPRL